MTQNIRFLIDHLDPLGQGVSRRTSSSKKPTITFIPKTLPGEEGLARVIKSAKGVEFAEVVEVTKSSIQRRTPECEHYARCGGCDYLHVSYDDEVAYKKEALHFSLRSINYQKESVECIPANQRFGYRNRVQLHYRHQHIGFVDAASDQILEVPGCKLVSPAIKQLMGELYTDKSWKKEHAGRGHVEIYQRPTEATTVMAWNQPYAHGGFSQVNNAMNTKLLDWLQQHCRPLSGDTVLELFSGDGNITDVLVHETMKRWRIDASPPPANTDNDEYLQIDLYDGEALPRFMRRSGWKKLDTLVLDPPRKGFPPLLEWVKTLKPSMIIYISCNPATLARDLQALMKDKAGASLTIEKIALCDLFPGTRHFETAVILRRS